MSLYEMIKTGLFKAAGNIPGESWSGAGTCIIDDQTVGLVTADRLGHTGTKRRSSPQPKVGLPSSVSICALFRYLRAVILASSNN